MKIAILSTISGYTWGGTEEVWFDLASRALGEGHSVMVAADYQVAESEKTSRLVKRGLEISTRKLAFLTRMALTNCCHCSKLSTTIQSILKAQADNFPELGHVT